MELPKFKYHPDPIKTGSIKKSDMVCECCNKQTGYVYTGSIYCKSNVENLCPWCIANGKAHEKYDAEFTSISYEEDKEDDECTCSEETFNEVFHRTPGFSSFQESDWQCHCNDLCEFHGIATVGDFRNISEKETERLYRVTYLDETELNELKKGDANEEQTYFFKFICRHCGELRFMMDLD